MRAAAAVECAVKSDAHSLGCLSHTAASRHVDVALRRESANHHAMHAQPTQCLDVGNHGVHLRLVVEKIATTRAYESVHPHAQPHGMHRQTK